MDVIKNIKQIRIEKGVNQEVIAEKLNITSSSWSRIESGTHSLKVNQLAKIAELFDMEVIDLFTYPKKYVDASLLDKANKISVTFEVGPENRDVLLSLIYKK